MKLPKYLILAYSCLAASIAFSQQSQPSCTAPGLKINISHASASGNDGAIRIESKDQFQPTIYLISRKGGDSQYRIRSFEISSVAAGQYLLLISDDDGRFCPKSVEVTVLNNKK